MTAVKNPKNNMYSDSKKNISPCVGCKHECVYCVNSFQRQMKRQRWRCEYCYTFIPHSHPERLQILKKALPDKQGKIGKGLPITTKDEFIWINSSGDITFADESLMCEILEIIKKITNRTFFFQTKDPKCFNKYDFPKNSILCITLETDKDEGYAQISKAPMPTKRFNDFCDIEHAKKRVTIEPIIEFNNDMFIDMLKELQPEIVTIGYDSKNCGLPEPSLKDTMELCKEIMKFTKVKTKTIRERY